MVTFKTPPFIFLLLLLSPSFTTASPASNSNNICYMKDSKVLLKIKESFNNPSLLSDWNKSTDCCNWYGIDCDEAGRVTRLSLKYTDISGPFSPSIGKLENLKELTVMGNTNLTGIIPPSIGKLKKLTMIQLAYNPLLTGPIPKTLCKLRRLHSLYLFDNNLTGQIPGCLGGKLVKIDLSNNRLSGSIPSSFLRNRSTNASVSLFSVLNNNLTGVVPASMGHVHFQQIDLTKNKFSDASVLFGERKKTVNVFLSMNRLSFNLSEVNFPLTMEVLLMDHNEMFGSIPQQITKLKKLSYFDVSYNKLCGRIPTGGLISKMSKELFVHNKCLCGAPLELCH